MKTKIMLGVILVLAVVAISGCISDTPQAQESQSPVLGHFSCPECNKTNSVYPIGLEVEHEGYGSDSNGYIIFYCQNEGCIFQAYSGPISKR